MFRCLILRNIINGRVCWRVYKNVRKTGKIKEEIFYLVSVRIPGKIILEDWKVGKYGTDRDQGHLFFVCLVGRIRSS